jgi:branched-chain amino acid transport system substrate-binding protein
MLPLAKPLRFLLTFVMLSLTVTLAQQPLRIGVVLPGRATTTSANWNELLSAQAWGRTIADRAVGVEVELVFRDGGTTPANTVSALQELVAVEAVHAVVCCVTAVSAMAVADVAGMPPILSLAEPLEHVQGSAQPLILPPGTEALASAMALHARAFGRGVGLMTLDNGYGRQVAAAVVAGLRDAGLQLTRAEDYPPGADVLTPEALLVAASEPSAVIVWGLPADSLTAIAGLRARGFDGPVYLPFSLASRMPGGVRNSYLEDALLAAKPVDLGESLLDGHQNAAAVDLYRRMLAQSYGPYPATAEGALVFDALELLLDAAELTLVYGVDPANTDMFRQAMRDALVSLGPHHGAAGSYDYDGENPYLAVAGGLVIATPRGRVLEPASP